MKNAFIKILTEYLLLPSPDTPISRKGRYRFTDILCKCLELQKGRCNNCKTICFNLNFLAKKVKLGHYFDVLSTLDIIPIEQYLDNIKSMLLFYFCRDCFKVQCSLDHPKYVSLIKKKLPYGFDM